MGIIWGALVGITLQFFINMEIGRYTLATGESVFVGLTRKLGKSIPIWFILSTLIPWMWPGIVASSAKVMGAGLGISNTNGLAVGMLIVTGLILTLGPVLYQTQEKMQEILILLGVPFVIGIAILFAKIGDWTSLAQGLIGKGEGFWFLPGGISISSFLAALAYSGAGGNLNLATSQNIREKGHGMGAYAGRITSILTGKKEEISLTGQDFEPSEENIETFRKWWKVINWEHGLVFWLTGLISMLLLALLAYSTVYGKLEGISGINFVIAEGSVVAEQIGALWGKIFLIVLGLMLFATQLSVMATTGKIMAENWAILNYKKFKSENLPRYFYQFLWLQIGLQLLVFLMGITEPLQLVLISAVLNAGTMFVYSSLISWLNSRALIKQIGPNILRKSMMGAAICFYGGFFIWSALQATGAIK